VLFVRKVAEGEVDRFITANSVDG